MTAVRIGLKRTLGHAASARLANGLTLLIYHRVGGGTPDERDLRTDVFEEQLDLLASQHRVLHLDTALDELCAGNYTPKIVVTFDDGFTDVHERALPLMADRGLPFTLYLATAYVGGQMHWDGSTASAPGPALSWAQLGELLASGLCTVGNHTHTHARPERLTSGELDRCTAEIEDHLGFTPRHFAYTWGIAVPAMEPALRRRFRSAALGVIGRNYPGDDLHRLRRVPVRQSDPLDFFTAKFAGRLVPERAYHGIVRMAKRARLRP